MKKTTLIIALLAANFTFAQRLLTIEEATLGNRSFTPKNIVAQQWKAGENAFTYLDATYQNLMIKKSANHWNEETLLTKAALQAAFEAKYPNAVSKWNMFPMNYKWILPNVISFDVTAGNSNYTVFYNIANKAIENVLSLDATGKNQTLNHNNSLVAWLEDNNINISTTQNTTKKVTTDTDKGIVNGSDYTHRQEFGIDKGMWWSPTEDKLLYYRKDETKVANYPLVNFETRIAEVVNSKYPMAGETSENVSLVVYDVKTDKKTTLQIQGDPEQYLTSVSWDANGKFIYVGVLNRDQNHLKFNKYSVETGKLVKTLFEEKNTTWVEPQHDIVFLPKNDKQFLYQTDFYGYNQLFLYNTDGKLIKNLGYKDVIVTNLLDFNAKGSAVRYIGTANNGLDRQLYEVDLKTGKTTQLTKASGYHNATASADGSFILDQYSSTTVPNKVAIIDTKKNVETPIITAENTMKDLVKMPKMEFVKLTSADGKTPLNGRIIYPLDYDATKKYPVMVYVYGGSHAQLVTNRWLGGASLFDYYMAQKGYVVFTVDNRGSDARGRDFTRVTHRNLGVAEMADQMKGVEYLKTLPFVDQDRMGVYGWSFGGFMTTSLMLDHADTFKVGVAGGPVMDWKWYEAMYGERYMDTPQTNEAGYKSTNTLDKVGKLKGDLLVIHGAQDPVVVQQHSMQFIEACIKAGKQVDYFLYPTHEHNVRGKDRIHLNEKIARYFDLHLK
ncbi:MAG: DPP IV N-terminal domain-containing protein [Flavobacterium sp.]|nr:DPP IV N-terminal domain-containing protein [Candidatus Neoflavobacterium equi]